MKTIHFMQLGVFKLHSKITKTQFQLSMMTNSAGTLKQFGRF